MMSSDLTDDNNELSAVENISEPPKKKENNRRVWVLTSNRSR